MDYYTYMGSPAWAIKRRETLALRGKYCERCGDDRYKFLNIHHVHYRTLGNEDPQKDLVVLCRNCHAEYHATFGKEPDEFTLRKFVTWKQKQNITIVRTRGWKKAQKKIAHQKRKINRMERERKSIPSEYFTLEKLRIRQERAKLFKKPV